MPKADSYVDSFASVKKSYIITLVFASLLVIAISGLDAKQYENFSLTGPRSSNKPYKNFETFYPFYLSEHSELTNRRLHLLGTTIVMLTMLFNPILVPCMFSGVSTGYLVCNIFSGLQHGIVEGVLMVAVFLGLAKYNGLLKQALYCLFIGYGFAWLGHFKFELNKPATFIYPSYSFMGDFRMWFDCMRGELRF